jgi:hypothetical protein
MACPTCPQWSKLKHGHDPTQPPSKPLKSPRNVRGRQHDCHLPAYQCISSLAHCREYIHNVYKLPSLEPTVRYVHAAAGVP